MPTAGNNQNQHVHSWSRKDKAVYCLDCSTHFTEAMDEMRLFYAKQMEALERQVELYKGLHQAALRGEVAAVVASQTKP
jgi:hypothetical protein